MSKKPTPQPLTDETDNSTWHEGLPGAIEALKAENARLKAELAALKGADYVPQPYPKMLHNGVIVQDEAEHKAKYPEFD